MCRSSRPWAARVAAAVLGVALQVAPASSAPVQIRSAPDGKVTGISDLIPSEGCAPGKVRGRVAKREFGRGGLYLTGIVLEERGGSRSHINVDDAYASRDAASVGRIKRSLEELLAVGRRVELGVFACGAAGRVLTIHAVRSL